jgi:hypothetical protein
VLTDIFIIGQAFQKITVQMPVWEILNISKKSG